MTKALAAVCAVCALAWTGTAAASYIADASNTDFANMHQAANIWDVPGFVDPGGQVFTAVRSGDLARVLVFIAQNGPQTDGTRIEITPVLGSGVPDFANPIGTTTIPLSGTTGYFSWSTADFSPAIPVIAGQQYAIVLDPINGSYEWGLSDEAGQSFWFDFLGTPFSLANEEAVFQVFLKGPDSPDELLANLIASLGGTGPGTSLASKASAIRAQLAAGSTQAACNGMTRSFPNEVRAQDGKSLTHAKALDLLGQIADAATAAHCGG